MGNMLKQRLIKPGRDFNYSEGQKVLANSAVKADHVVRIMGSDGPFSKVVTAGGLTDASYEGRLLVAKHDIPAGGYGVCVPWKLVTTIDTSGDTIGDPVFLKSGSIPAGVTNLTTTAPTTGPIIIVGRVLTAATVANGGAIMVQASAPESREFGGDTNAAGVVSGRSVEQLRVILGANTTEKLFTLDYSIIVTDVHAISAGASSSASVNVKNGSDPICVAFTFGAIKDVTRAVEIDPTKTTVTAGANLSLQKSGDNGTAGDVIVVSFIRA